MPVLIYTVPVNEKLRKMEECAGFWAVDWCPKLHGKSHDLTG